MLEIKDITFSFDKKEKKPLVKNLSFKVKKGEILFISGKSGLGKSTLLDLISGFHDNNLIWSGKIYLNKLDINKYASRLVRPERPVVQNGRPVQNGRQTTWTL